MLRFTHAEHSREVSQRGADSVLQCVNCHAAEGASWMHVSRGELDRCFQCHGIRVAHLAAPDTAGATGHVPLPEAAGLSTERIAAFPTPPSHRQDGFATGEHGKLAQPSPGDSHHRGVAASRATCHAREFCTQCHVNAPESPPSRRGAGTSLAGHQGVAQETGQPPDDPFQARAPRLEPFLARHLCHLSYPGELHRLPSVQSGGGRRHAERVRRPWPRCRDPSAQTAQPWGRLHAAPWPPAQRDAQRLQRLSCPVGLPESATGRMRAGSRVITSAILLRHPSAADSRQSHQRVPQPGDVLHHLPRPVRSHVLPGVAAGEIYS